MKNKIETEEHPIQWLRPLRYSADVAEEMRALYPSADIERCAHFGGMRMEAVALRNAEGELFAIVHRPEEDDDGNTGPWTPASNELASMMVAAIADWQRVLDEGKN